MTGSVHKTDKRPTEKQAAKSAALAFEREFAPSVKVYLPGANGQIITTASHSHVRDGVCRG